MIGGQRTAAAALLISVFMAGALGGAVGTKLLDRWVGNDRMGRPSSFERSGRFPPHPGAMDRDHGRGPSMLAPMRISDRLARELNLTEDQKEQVLAILEARTRRSEERLSEILPRLKADLDSMFLEVREILTPEQQQLFDERREREEERMFRRSPEGRPPTASRPGP